jgi:hypothetical protein
MDTEPSFLKSSVKSKLTNGDADYHSDSLTRPDHP